MNRKDFLKAAFGVIAAPFVVKEGKAVKFSQPLSEITQGNQIYIKGSDLNILSSRPSVRHLFNHDPGCVVKQDALNDLRWIRDYQKRNYHIFGKIE